MPSPVVKEKPYFKDAPVSCDGCIEVFTLGRFKVCHNGKVISEKSKRSQKLWELFKYLISHREKCVQQDTLIELLWPEQEIGDPAHALRTLTYRLRRVFAEELSPEYKVVIIPHRGCYSINKEVPLWLDTVQFEKLCAEAHRLAGEGQTSAAIATYYRALDYYQGDYLPECMADWVVPLRTYYRNMYIQNFLELYSLLKESQNFDAAAKACSAALLVAPFEEELHLRQIEALALGGKTSQAREHYEYITRYFTRELGVKPSLDVEELLLPAEEEIPNTVDALSAIRKKLAKPDSVKGAFLCGPGLFQPICRLESRRLERSGYMAYLCQFSFRPKGGERAKANELNQFCYELEKVLLNCLRKGDVVCRWNHDQYLVLLSNLNAANARKVAKRVLSHFQKECGASATGLLHCMILPLLQTSPGRKSVRQGKKPVK